MTHYDHDAYANGYVAGYEAGYKNALNMAMESVTKKVDELNAALHVKKKSEEMDVEDS